MAVSVGNVNKLHSNHFRLHDTFISFPLSDILIL